MKAHDYWRKIPLFGGGALNEYGHEFSRVDPIDSNETHPLNVFYYQLIYFSDPPFPCHEGSCLLGKIPLFGGGALNEYGHEFSRVYMIDSNETLPDDPFYYQ